MPRSGVPRGGHCRPKRPTRLPTGSRRRVLTTFREQVKRILAFFRKRAKRIRGGTAAGSDSHRAPKAGSSCKGTEEDRIDKAWCSRTGTLQAQNRNTASDGVGLSVLYPSLQYSRQSDVLAAILLWQWSASPFVVQKWTTSYSCTKQYLMAEIARPY